MPTGADPHFRLRQRFVRDGRDVHVEGAVEALRRPPTGRGADGCHRAGVWRCGAADQARPPSQMLLGSLICSVLPLAPPGTLITVFLYALERQATLSSRVSLQRLW